MVNKSQISLNAYEALPRLEGAMSLDEALNLHEVFRRNVIWTPVFNTMYLLLGG